MRTGFFNNVYDSCYDSFTDLIGSDSGGGGATPPPFNYDSNTYWWDFKNTNNTKELTGTDTFSYIPDRIAGVKNLLQNNKASQPLVDADGSDFSVGSNRIIYLENKQGITNGTQGYYFGCNVKIVASGDLLNIMRNTSNAYSRGRLFTGSGRNLAFRVSNNEGTAYATIAQSRALTLGQSYTIEMTLDISSSTTDFKLYIDGLLETLTTNSPTAYTTSFPTTDSFNFFIGNNNPFTTTSWGDSFKECIFYNGIISNDMRTSISNYLVSNKI